MPWASRRLRQPKSALSWAHDPHQHPPQGQPCTASPRDSPGPCPLPSPRPLPPLGTASASLIEAPLRAEPGLQRSPGLLSSFHPLNPQQF